MNEKQQITIQHPESWELLVSLEDKRARYILFTPAVANSLHVSEVEWDDDTLQGLEDAVYSTPLLLDDYKRVRVVVYPRHFILLPQDVSDDDCTAMLREAFPSVDGDVTVTPMPLNGVKIAYALPLGTMAFVGRTFNYPAVCPHLVPLCEHFKSLSADGGNTMYLHLARDRYDLAVYCDGKLMCANSYPFSGEQDVLYFTLAAWRAHAMDQLSDELLLLGDNELQATMIPLLREFVKHVKPADFPAAAMRLGRNAMQAPLTLTLLALCE